MTLVVLIIAEAFQPVNNTEVYKLQLKADGNNFFSYFSFFTNPDPTDGYTNYVDENTAQQKGLVQQQGGNIYIGVDHTNTVPSNARGRDSVRLTSKLSFKTGLFVLDLLHMPTGCGTWPAWWLFGPNWPNNGEVDIIEGINTNTQVATTLHTGPGCTMQGEPKQFTGNWATGSNGQPSDNCYVNAPGQYPNQGCSIVGSQGSFGAPFNQNNGGVYTCEITSSFIRMWYFSRSQIPPDINNGNPNPSGWGTPYAYFTLGSQCTNSHFNGLQVVFDDTFCGQWAGSEFPSQCPGLGTCDNYVQNNPQKFIDAYWLIRYMAVYQNQ